VPTPSSLNQSVRCPKQRPHLHCSLLPFLFPPRLRPRRVEATARALPNLRVTPVTVVRERALPNLQVTPVTVVRERALPSLRVKRVLRITQAFEKPRRAAMRRYRIEAWQLLSLWATRKMFASEFSLGGATNVLHRMLGRRHSCTH